MLQIVKTGRTFALALVEVQFSIGLSQQKAMNYANQNFVDADLRLGTNLHLLGLTVDRLFLYHVFSLDFDFRLACFASKLGLPMSEFFFIMPKLLLQEAIQRLTNWLYYQDSEIIFLTKLIPIFLGGGAPLCCLELPTPVNEPQAIME